ncbi:MAG: hypothetical protein ACRDVP_12575 [Acidimicrobiales bacterium]
MINGSARFDCERFADSLGELAIGALDGPERTALVTHLQGCSNCSEELDRLSGAVDALLVLAPQREPPAGFEARLFERMGFQKRRLGFRPRRWVAVAAASVTGALGLSLGLAFGLTSLAPVPQAISADLVANHSARGEVYVVPGSPGWVFMSVEGADMTARVTCMISTDSNKRLTVGSFWLRAGSGSWVSPLAVRADEVRSAWIVDAQGTVVARAHLGA